MHVRLTRTVEREGQLYGPNWVFSDLTAAEAEELIASNVAVRHTPQPKPKAPEAEKPTDPAALSEAIIAAMGKLPIEKGGDGKPNVKPLSEILGYRITGAERDAALEVLNARKA